MSNDVEALFHARTVFEGREVEMTFKVVPFGELAPLLVGRPDGREYQISNLRARLFWELKSFDGKRLPGALAQRLAEDPRVVADFCAAHERLFEAARRAGRLFARCPSCATEAEISFAYLELRLGFVPPPLLSPDGAWLEPPALARVSFRGKRHGDLPLAAGIRAELPSRRWSLAGDDRPGAAELQVLDVAHENVAWERFWPVDAERTPEHPWWYSTNPPFRAAVRLAAAIARFDRGGEPSPLTFETMPAIDLAFLDMVVMATQFTDEPALPILPHPAVPAALSRPRQLPVDCRTCAARYLPLI
jgi:hypothetical protein